MPGNEIVLKLDPEQYEQLRRDFGDALERKEEENAAQAAEIASLHESDEMMTEHHNNEIQLQREIIHKLRETVICLTGQVERQEERLETQKALILGYVESERKLSAEIAQLKDQLDKQGQVLETDWDLQDAALLADVERQATEIADLEHERKDNDVLLWKVAEQQKEIERLRAQAQADEYILSEAVNSVCPTCGELQQRNKAVAGVVGRGRLASKCPERRHGMNKTSIEWANYVWNPVTGCTKVSAGCKNCYAEAIAKRFWGEREFGDVMCHPERLDQPTKVQKPGRVFVNSMSDLFHPDVPVEFIAAVWHRMINASQHTFIILTKRPERMFDIVPELFREWITSSIHTPNNVWLGVSVEDQKTADERIPILLQTPAAVRFVSCEPLLAPVELGEWLGSRYDYRPTYDFYPPEIRGDGKPILIKAGIDWVIAGCESGPNRRHMDIECVRWLRDQCVSADVPFFLKQMEVDGKVVKMPELDGRIWAQYPGGTP